MRPRIVQTDEQVGFHWATPHGRPTTLRHLVAADDEPARLAATHLSALDDTLIDTAGRFGQVLGGGRRPSADEWETLAELYRCLDRSCLEYAEAIAEINVAPDVRAGKIIGTAVLVSILARQALGRWDRSPWTVNSTNPRWAWSGVTANWFRPIRTSRGRAAGGWCAPRPDRGCR